MKRSSLILILTIVALVLLVTGFFAPLFTMSKFFIFNNTVSLYSVLFDLWDEHYFGLFIIIMSFSVLFPMIKIVMMFYLQMAPSASRHRHKKLINVLELVGKWSMLDVFVVAILLVAIKLGPMADVTVHYGVYVFSSAIIIMMLVSRYICKAR